MERINSNDVLLGRGGNSFRHAGNKKFRDLANSLAERYCDSSKLQKSEISRTMIRHVKNLDPPGRFLKKNTANDKWEQVDDSVAREKASQTLRDAVTALNLPNKRNVTATPKHASTKSNVDNSEDYGYGDDLQVTKYQPPLDYIDVPDSTLSMKVSSNRPRYENPITLTSDTIIRGHDMNQQLLRSQRENFRGTFERATGYETCSDDKYMNVPQINRQEWGLQNNCSTNTMDRTARSSLYREGSGYLQSTHSNPFHNATHLHQSSNPQAPPSSLSDEKFFYPTQRVDGTLKHSMLDKVSLERSTSDTFIKSPGRHHPTTFASKQSEMEMDGSSSPDRSILKTFFEDVDMDMDIDMNGTSPSRSFHSPDTKKLKKQISFDDFGNLLYYCKSTSHSVDSIDSFVKSL